MTSNSRNCSSFENWILMMLCVPQVASGREWFIHTIYTVRSKESANRGIGKRSLEYHSLVSSSSDLTSSVKGHRSRRSAGDEVPEVAEDIGAEDNRGTNIMHIALDRTKRRAAGLNEMFANGLEPSELNAEEEQEGLVTVVGGLVGVLLTALVVVTVVLVLRSRQKDVKEGWREGVQEVVKGSVSTEPMLVVRMQDCHNSSEVWGSAIWGWTDGQRDEGAFIKTLGFSFLFLFFNWY